MSTTTMSSTIVWVSLTDDEGHEIGRTVPVTVEYLVDVDCHYGEDADGRRGGRRVEYVILESRIELADLLTMHSGQIEQVLADAASLFHSTARHF